MLLFAIETRKTPRRWLPAQARGKAFAVLGSPFSYQVNQYLEAAQFTQSICYWMGSKIQKILSNIKVTKRKESLLQCVDSLTPSVPSLCQHLKHMMNFRRAVLIVRAGV